MGIKTRSGIKGLNLNMNHGPMEFASNVGLFYFYTHAAPIEGRVNQDALCILETSENVLVAVADGLGGHSQGDLASRTIITTLMSELKSLPSFGPTEILGAIGKGNQKLVRKKSNLGTTLTLCHFKNSGIQFYSIGDSPGLFITKGKIRHKTTEQTALGYAEESGIVPEGEIQDHPEGHHLTNVLGDSGYKVEVSSFFRLKKNDRILVASDGLTQNLSLTEIEEALRQLPVGEFAALCATEIMAKMALDGFPDDLSLVIFERS